MRNLPPIEVAIPDHVKPKLTKSFATLEVVFAQDDRRRSRNQLSRLASSCVATISAFLTSKYPDFNTGPKVSKPQLLAGPAKGSYFGIKVKVVCSELQLAELLSLTGETGFLELGKLGSSNDSLRMLFTPRLSAKQPAQPTATASRVYQLRWDNMPEGVVDLPIADVAAILGPAGFDVRSLHPVHRSGSRGQAAADSMVVVVKTSVPLTGRRALNISGFPGRNGKVRTHFTVYKYPALPPLAIVCPGPSAAATADAAATAATTVSAATKPAAAVPVPAAQSAVTAAASAPSTAVRAPTTHAPTVLAATPVQPARAQPAPATATAVKAAAMLHATASTLVHASAAQPASVPATPASASAPRGTLPAAAAPTAMQSLKRTAPQQQPDDSSRPTAPATSAPPRTAPASTVLPHGPSLPIRAQASHSAPTPCAVAQPAASLAASASAVAVAMSAPATSAVVAKPPGPMGNRGGSAFTFKFAAPGKSSATKRAQPPQLAPTPSGVVIEDIGAAPAKRQELAPAAQSAPSVADDDAMTEH